MYNQKNVLQYESNGIILLHNNLIYWYKIYVDLIHLKGRSSFESITGQNFDLIAWIIDVNSVKITNEVALIAVGGGSIAQEYSYANWNRIL